MTIDDDTMCNCHDPILIVDCNTCLRAQLEQARAALRAVEWGSCDGCGSHRNCAHCGVGREVWSDEADELVPGVHKADCPVGLALTAAAPTPPPQQ